MKETITITNEATLLRLATLRSRYKCKTLEETIDRLIDPETQLVTLIEDQLNATEQHDFFSTSANKSLAKRKLTEIGLFHEALSTSPESPTEFFKQAVIEHSRDVVGSLKRPKTEAQHAILEKAYQKLKAEGIEPLMGRLMKETGISNRPCQRFLKAKHPDTYELTIRVGRGNGVDSRIEQVKAEMAEERRLAALEKASATKAASPKPPKKTAKKAAKKTAKKAAKKTTRKTTSKR